MYSLKLVCIFQLWIFLLRFLFFSLLFFNVNQLLWLIFISLRFITVFPSAINFLHWYCLFCCFSCSHYYHCAIHYRGTSTSVFSSSYRQNTLSRVSKKRKQGCFGSTCVNFASLSSGISTLREQMLILKLAHNWMVVLQMENWLELVQSFSIKHFFLLENAHLSKAKSWEYISFNFTFLMKISQVWDVFFHCSKTLE